MTDRPLTKNIDLSRGPLDIGAYEAVNGYNSIKAIAKGLAADDVLELVKQSGLKGRGGAAINIPSSSK